MLIQGTFAKPISHSSPYPSSSHRKSTVYTIAMWHLMEDKLTAAPSNPKSTLRLTLTLYILIGWKYPRRSATAHTHGCVIWISGFCANSAVEQRHDKIIISDERALISSRVAGVSQRVNYIHASRLPVVCSLRASFWRFGTRRGY